MTQSWFFAAARRHRGSADVDGLDLGPLEEWVEVRDDEVEGFDVVRLEIGAVRFLTAVGEKSAVDLRVQRDHAVVEHLG